jgi:hypothetical protein
MNFKQTLFALAIGGMSLTGVMNAHAANTFSFVGGGDDSSRTSAPTGSFISFSPIVPEEDDLPLYVSIRAADSTGIPGPNGILNFDIENTITVGAGGSAHNSGNMIDRDAGLFLVWAAHSTTGALEITWDGVSNTAAVNMSDWRWNYNGGTINVGTGSPALLSNQDGIWGNGDDTLDYSVMMDPGFNPNTNYNLHLVGSASLTPVPEASTYGMMLAGLGLVGFAVRRRK